MKRTKVRFNLGKGENYMKWKITHSNGDVEYLSPTEVQLIMTDCTLKNNLSSAKNIFEGGEKVVCAWILCDKIEIRLSGFNQSDMNGKRLRYNPRVEPNWTMCSINMDNTQHERIESVDYGLYKTKKK